MAVITISRQFGAGGRTIGEKVSQRLGYRYVHEDIVKEIALKAKCSDEKIKAMERRGTSKLTRFLEKIVSASYIDRLIAEDYRYVDEGTYVDAVKSVMLDLYEKNNAVIVGRAGQFILKDKPNAYHILLVAP
ncbi:MAG: cytidylate kinase-like family protein, partial [Desulfatiglandales bacterium]